MTMKNFKNSLAAIFIILFISFVALIIYLFLIDYNLNFIKFINNQDYLPCEMITIHSTNLSNDSIFIVNSPIEEKNENLFIFLYNNFDIYSSSHLIAVTSISIALVFLNLILCYNIVARYYIIQIFIALRDKYLDIDSFYYNKVTRLHDFFERTYNYFNYVSIFNLTIINSCLFFGLIVTLQIIVRTIGN